MYYKKVILSNKNQESFFVENVVRSRLIIVYIVRIQDPILKVKTWSINHFLVKIYQVPAAVFFETSNKSSCTRKSILTPFVNSHLFQEIYWWYTAQPPGGHLQGCLRGFNVKLTQVGYWQTLQPCNKHCNIAKKHCKNCKSYLNISHLPIGNAIHCHGCQLQSYKDYLGLFNFPFYSVFSSSSFCSAPFYHCSG